uniref:Peptidase n=1 Tax=Neobacillus citreus TaxID=2833578 RepID=A0A942SXW0_9BACI
MASAELSDAEKDQRGGDPVVDAYWTTERLQNATPLEGPALNDEQLRVAADQVAALPETEEISSPPAVPTLPTKEVRTPGPVTKWPTANGKIFFYDPTMKKDYVCSGAVVNSTSKRLVATAGHCVHGGKGGTWHENVIFIPKYSAGSAPYGEFQAARLRTFTDWMNEGPTARGFNSDVAFATMYANASGDLPVNKVGGHGLLTGGSLGSFDGHIFGYPANLDGGAYMYACSRSTGTRLYGLYNFNSVNGCKFGGGASGGPWLANYSNTSALGSIRSVNSFGPSDSVEYIAGPFFRSDVRALWENANGDW